MAGIAEEMPALKLRRKWMHLQRKMKSRRLLPSVKHLYPHKPTCVLVYCMSTVPEKKLNLNQHLIGKAPIVMCIIGGVKGMRAVIQEVLVNPILSDQFGFSDQATTYFFLVFFIGPPTGTLLL